MKSQLTNSNCALREVVHIDQGVISFQYVKPLSGTRSNSIRLYPYKESETFPEHGIGGSDHCSGTCTLTRATELHTKWEAHIWTKLTVDQRNSVEF